MRTRPHPSPTAPRPDEAAPPPPKPKSAEATAQANGSATISCAAAHEFLYPLQPLLNGFHARGVAQSDVVRGSKGGAGHGGDLLLLEQLRAKIHRTQPCLGNLREKVKGPFGIDAGNAGHVVQPLPREGPPPGVLRQPDRQVVLR